MRSARRRAVLHLLVLLSVSGGLACRAIRTGGGSVGRPARDSAAVVATPPGDTAGLAVRDSVKADSVRRDSVSAPVPRTDSAARADSMEKAAPDSTSKTAAARKKKAPPATRSCILDFADSPPETRLTYSRISETVSNTFIGGGFVGNCQGENNRLRADSAEQFQQIGVVNLYGNVVYLEPDKMEIRANHATYFTREGRLYADGNVLATQLTTGSSFSGPSIEYTRAGPSSPVARMVAPQRSTATLVERDSLGRQQPPVTILANRFEDLGDSLLLAWGEVRISRQSLNGQSDSAAFDKIAERARLVRAARLVNRDTAQPFTLVGDTIDLFSANRQVERVVSRHRASATSNSMVIGAEVIDLRLDSQQLREAHAFGTGRAKATTPQQDVDADSMHILMQAKRVREVRALGGARALGVPDTTKISTTDRDVLRGDSVFAYFDTSVTPNDSTTPSRVREIRALGSASALFHLANAKGKSAPPGINYVRGLRIEVLFDTGTVREVRVDSSASGVYIEPAPDSLADTTAADTAARSRPGRPPSKPGEERPPSSPAKRPPTSPFALLGSPIGAPTDRPTFPHIHS